MRETSEKSAVTRKDRNMSTEQSGVFERLLQKHAEINRRQCECGGNLEGECPECGNLQEIGDSKGVNPPKPASANETEVESDEPTTPKETYKGSDEPKNTNETTQGSVCPTCGKVFKHIKRHKCKNKPDEKETRLSPDHPLVIGQSCFLNEPKTANDQPMYRNETPHESDQPQTSREPNKGSVQPTLRKEPPQESEPSSPKETEDKSAQSTLPKETCALNEQSRKPTESSLKSVPIFDLYIDVVIENNEDVEDIILLEDLIRPVAQGIAKEHKVGHWKCINFGKGVAILASTFEEYLKTHEGQISIVARTESLEWGAVGSVLRSMARNIFVGV